MSGSNTAPESGFDAGVRSLLQEVDCREAILESEKEAIYRLRHAGYLRAGMLPPGTPEIFKDRFDEAENGKTFGFYIEGRLASSIRLHVASRRFPICPAMTAYSDYLSPLIETGRTIVDPTRFVVDADAARRYPRLPYATVRIVGMACEYYGADYGLATVRTEHQAFYQRIYGRMVASKPRTYPGIVQPVVMLLLDYRREKDRIQARYPFLGSTETERRAIFAPNSLRGEPGDSPSAPVPDVRNSEPPIHALAERPTRNDPRKAAC